MLSIHCNIVYCYEIDDSLEFIWVEVREAAGKTVLGVMDMSPNLS